MMIGFIYQLILNIMSFDVGEAYTHIIMELPGLWLGCVFTVFFRGRLDFDLFNFQIIICSVGL